MAMEGGHPGTLDTTQLHISQLIWHSIEHLTATYVFVVVPLHQSHVDGSKANVLSFAPWTWPANEKVRDWLEQGWARWEEEKPEW